MRHVANGEKAMKNGIRVITAMNRKGGCGKSTLIRGLASAAQDRGETVTIFDTDGSRGLHKWMERSVASGNWSEDVTVVATLNASQVEAAIDEIFEMPDQEHLILIDTFGGGADPAAQDLLASKSHLIVAPCMLSDEDYEETKETAIWYGRMKQRAENPEDIPPFKVMVSRLPVTLREPEKLVLAKLAKSLPMFNEFISARSVYGRMGSGLLGKLRDNIVNKGVALHIQDALDEMTEALEQMDKIIGETQ